MLLVLADDRTGALETAGICADAGWGPVTVVVGSPAAADSDVGSVVVVDLASRHLEPADAARRAGTASVRAARVAHKIDSTLRGNWAHELVAVQQARSCRVVLVPAFPELGRTCTDGVVSAHGVPVNEGHAAADARRGVVSSKPADHLRAAGTPAVTEVANAPALQAWLAETPVGFAVCDALTAADLTALAEVWVTAEDVVFAGTARSIGAAAAAILRGAGGPSATQSLRSPALVVCGSLHPMARRQLEALAAGGAVWATPGPGEDEHEVISALRNGQTAFLATAVPAVIPVSTDDAHLAASALTTAVNRVLGAVAVPTVVVIGGDTAAALLGDAPVSVGGTVATGMPWLVRPGGQVIITRAGGFGTEGSLVDLLATLAGRWSAPGQPGGRTVGEERLQQRGRRTGE